MSSQEQATAENREPRRRRFTWTRAPLRCGLITVIGSAILLAIPYLSGYPDASGTEVNHNASDLAVMLGWLYFILYFLLVHPWLLFWKLLGVHHTWDEQLLPPAVFLASLLNGTIAACGYSAVRGVVAVIRLSFTTGVSNPVRLEKNEKGTK